MPKALMLGSIVTKETIPFRSSNRPKFFCNLSRPIFWQIHACARCVYTRAYAPLYIALIIERIDNRRVGSFRVACVNADPKTGESNPQASREIASMQLS